MTNTIDIQNAPALPTEGTTIASGKGVEWACPEFKVSGVFSSHMVLQRDKHIRVWGFSRSIGSTVTGEFMGETVHATVIEASSGGGSWTLTFSPHAYTREPQRMVIWRDDQAEQKMVLEDILIGDVWLIGGQSNAELTLAPCMSLTPSVEFCEEDNFRLFTQTQAFVYANQAFCQEPQPDIINSEWCWRRPGRDASLAFSAMGWYFAREMTKQIDVPLGMIMMCAGGACIRELLPEALAHAQGYFSGANVRESGYYNTLIHPLEGLAVTGQVFFQGESEGGARELAEKYAYELALLVADERQRFETNFPFYNVQLSSYREEGSQYFPWLDVVRMQQFDALRLIPDSTLTVDMDLGAPDGYPDWAHSPRKLELGERLAALVLARQYGIGSSREVASPMPTAAYRSADGQTITVEFENVSSGLTVSGHDPVDSLGMTVEGFSIGSYDHRTPAHATLTGRCTVTVDIPKDAPDVSCVSYAYFPIVTPDNATLRGGNNLPAPAFSLTL